MTKNRSCFNIDCDQEFAGVCVMKNVVEVKKCPNWKSKKHRK
jgi:hypothetical protein